MAGRPTLSIVLPAHDEAARIRSCIERVQAFLGAQAYESELIVVSDGSRDATASIARESGGGRVEVIELPVNRGKGFAVRVGVAAAQGETVLFSDVDLSTPLDEVAGFLRHHAEGADVVFGSRSLPSSRVGARQVWWREAMGRSFNRIVRWLVDLDTRDSQCGFKSFRREAARAIFRRTRIDRYAFDVEVLWIARGLGLRVVEAPVAWSNDPHSKVHPIRDSARMLLDLATIRRNAARGAYEGPP